MGYVWPYRTWTHSCMVVAHSPTLLLMVHCVFLFLIVKLHELCLIWVDHIEVGAVLARYICVCRPMSFNVDHSEKKDAHHGRRANVIRASHTIYKRMVFEALHHQLSIRYTYVRTYVQFPYVREREFRWLSLFYFFAHHGLRTRVNLNTHTIRSKSWNKLWILKPASGHQDLR